MSTFVRRSGKLLSRSLRKMPCVCLGVVLAFAASGALAQAQPQPQTPAQSQRPAAPESTLKNMLTALQTNSLADFVADGDTALKAGVNPQMFASLSAQFGPRLAQGYTATFLGTLNQQGHTVYLWKLVFKDGRDDLLFTMAVRDGKVAGFVLR